jgi:hypothetical protein
VSPVAIKRLSGVKAAMPEKSLSLFCAHKTLPVAVFHATHFPQLERPSRPNRVRPSGEKRAKSPGENGPVR